MLGDRSIRIILSGGAVALAVLLFFSNRVPEAAGEEKGKVARSPVEEKIQQALSIVNNGKRPMKGIMQLRSIAEEHPDEPEAQWQLGLLSIRSGQYEKAVGRFEKVLSIDPQGYKDAYLYLGKTYATLGDSAKAIQNLQHYRNVVEADSTRRKVEGLIHQFKDKKRTKEQ